MRDVCLSSQARRLLWALSQEGVKFKVQGLFPQCRLLELQTKRMKTFKNIQTLRRQIKELFDTHEERTYSAGTKLFEVIDLSIKVIGHD